MGHSPKSWTWESLWIPSNTEYSVIIHPIPTCWWILLGLFTLFWAAWSRWQNSNCRSKLIQPRDTGTQLVPTMWGQTPTSNTLKSSEFLASWCALSFLRQHGTWRHGLVMDLRVLGWLLGLVILVVFSNLKHSMIWICTELSKELLSYKTTDEHETLPWKKKNL